MEQKALFTEPWYSEVWFTEYLFNEAAWAHPNVRYLVALVPLFFILRWAIRYFTNQKLAVAILDNNIKKGVLPYFIWLPNLFLMLFVANIILALARPQSSNEHVEQWTEGIDIILMVDISLSMKVDDLKPNRLEASKQTCNDFIKGRFQDRIGLVIFSGEAYSLSPLTTDYDLLTEYVEDINFDMIETRGTAIGDALAAGTNRMRESESESKVIILLSDGESNSGNIDPITAAQMAESFGVTIYTIAIGKEGEITTRTGPFNIPQTIVNTLDETTLRKIADIGKGKFYRVQNNSMMQEVFEEIDRMEKAEIKESRYKQTTDYYYVYLYWALCSLLVWLLFKATPLTNILQD